MDVVGLGALNVDMIYKVKFEHLQGIEKGREREIEIKHLPSLKKILNKEGKLLCKSGGGSAANTIYTLSRMGFSCGFIGKVGEDAEGSFLIEDMQKAGVDTTRVKREGDTGICFVLVDEEGERSILVLPGTNDSLVFSHIDTDYLNSAKILHTTSFIGDTSFETQKQAILQTKVPVSFDPGEPHASKGWGELLPIIRKTWILFSTDKEVELLTKKQAKSGSGMLLRQGVKVLVCKWGQTGSSILFEEKEIFIPARKVNAVDTTGAGDVYAAGFLAGIFNNLAYPECGRLATEAARMSITGFGRLCYPDKRFLLNFLQNLRAKHVC